MTRPLTPREMVLSEASRTADPAFQPDLGQPFGQLPGGLGGQIGPAPVGRAEGAREFRPPTRIGDLERPADAQQTGVLGRPVAALGNLAVWPMPQRLEDWLRLRTRLNFESNNQADAARARWTQREALPSRTLYERSIYYGQTALYLMGVNRPAGAPRGGWFREHVINKSAGIDSFALAALGFALGVVRHPFARNKRGLRAWDYRPRPNPRP